MTPATWPSSPAASRFDCFYVYPTASLAKVRNATLAVTPLEKFVAHEEAAPYSGVCNVWAPLYREQTLRSVLLGLAGNQTLMRSTAAVAYNSLLPTWHWFLAHSGNKPIILIGDSQGSTILIHLISAEIDHDPAALHRLVVAILVGGNLQVPAGKLVGSTFTKVPLCTTATQAGCAIAFSAYPSQPPPDSVFGRPGQGTSLQAWETAKAGQQVACVNPAALTGGTARPRPLPAHRQPAGPERASHQPMGHLPRPLLSRLRSTAAEQPGSRSPASPRQPHSSPRPGKHPRHLPLRDTGPAWGYHDFEYWLTMGNLLHDLTREEAAWQSSH